MAAELDLVSAAAVELSPDAPDLDGTLGVLSFTSLFPSSVQPLHGIFVKERLAAMGRLAEVKVVAPVPYFPPIERFERYYHYSQIPHRDRIDGLDVLHPRFVSFPKIGKRYDGWLMYLASLACVRRHVDLRDIDVIDAHWAYPDGYAAVLLGKRLGKPVAVTIRGDDINIFPQLPGRGARVLAALTQADLCVAVSESLKSAAVARGVPAAKVETIPNGVDPCRFRPSAAGQARGELGLPEQGRIVLFVGRIHPSKGLHVLIEAVSALVADGRATEPVHVVVVGGEDREAQGYLAGLREQVRAAAMDPQVHFVGAVASEELFKWYGACDVVCLPTEREGWPNVVLEAFACGRPVVATAVGGIPEIVTSEELGILVADMSRDTLAGALERALSRSWNEQLLVGHARSQTWDTVARRALAALRRISRTSSAARERARA